MPGMDGLLRDRLSDLALRIATAGFAALWHGQAARPEELVAAPAGDLRRAIGELVERGRVEIGDDGGIVGIHGLTLRRTRHGFLHAGQFHRTWCAFDSIGIPAALGIDAEARTTCPSCGAALAVALRAGQPEPTGVALWLPAPNIRHVLVDFCAAADLYCGRDHLVQRVDATRQPGQVVDVEGAAVLGRSAWADVAGLGLDGQSRRP